MAKKNTINIGDKVGYTDDWLLSTGLYHDMKKQRGIVKEIQDLGGIRICVLDWDLTFDKVAEPNLKVYKKKA
jgi:hypothetical protein